MTAAWKLHATPSEYASAHAAGPAVLKVIIESGEPEAENVEFEVLEQKGGDPQLKEHALWNKVAELCLRSQKETGVAEFYNDINNCSQQYTLNIELDSEIPQGSGMGSSAAYSCALSAIFWQSIKII